MAEIESFNQDYSSKGN